MISRRRDHGTGNAAEKAAAADHERTRFDNVTPLRRAAIRNPPGRRELDSPRRPDSTTMVADLLMPTPEPTPNGSPMDRLLRVFGDVRPGEGAHAMLMFLNVFVLLLAYYILKTVREPLILTTGGAELKSYAAGAQAAVLLGYVPLYGWLVSRLSRGRLLVTVVLFFVACIEVFVVAGRAAIPFVGFAFYVWVGIFSLTMIAQFWSFANDVYTKGDGDRLFPLIAVGSTAGAPLGAAAAQALFSNGVSPWLMMQIAAALLLLHLGLYTRVWSRPSVADPSAAVPSKSGSFGLVLGNPYLRVVALLLVLLNIVNTTGEFILARLVTEQAATLAAADPDFDRGAFIGAFYGSYFFWVNVISVVLQAFLVSRIVKRFGFRGALFALPLLALGAYSVVVLGAGLALVRVIKTAENSVDYSVMNTAKQMLWLPTTREQKFKAKQAIDTFFVRSGDLLSAGVVFLGTHVLLLGPSGFAATNVVVVLFALFVAARLVAGYNRLTAPGRG
jgi:ATP:ADP antiporter, AAA family